MQERNLRNKRNLQAENIVNNLKRKSNKVPTQNNKRIKKNKKKSLTRKSSVSSQSSNTLLIFKDSGGRLKRVQFLLNKQSSDSISVKDEPIDSNINISDMFLQTYRKLMKHNTVKDNFYNDVRFNPETNSLFLFNTGAEDYFEIFKGSLIDLETEQQSQNIMKQEDFIDIVKQYNLNNLYC